jgi:predicted acylesterase/phospholipase RssA
MIPQLGGVMGKSALFLGPGGPFGAVEIGVLKTLHQHGKTFDIIAGNSIGSAIALTYASPATRYRGDRVAAISDLKRYTSLNPSLAGLTKKSMPFNFRIWHKTWGEYNHLYENLMKRWLDDNILRFYDGLPKLWQDTIGLFCSFLTPINLQWEFPRDFLENYRDLPQEHQNALGFWISLMTTLIPKSRATGFILALHEGMRKLIDFDALKAVPQHLYIGALNLRNRQVTVFPKEVITPRHLQASTTVIFMNELCWIDGDPYAESTYVDAYNFKQVFAIHPDIEKVVLIDILGLKSWVYEPTDLMDAFNVAITGGFANSARDDLAVFEERYLNKRNEAGALLYHQKPIEYIKIHYEVPEDIRPTWSEDVMDRLEEIGRNAALDYLDRI